jgi:hypothetical protein
MRKQLTAGSVVPGAHHAVLTLVLAMSIPPRKHAAAYDRHNPGTPGAGRTLLLWNPTSIRHVVISSPRGGSEIEWSYERLYMPWTSNDAERHTHKATTPALKELWAKVANETLERTADEGRAIREANAVVGRQAEAR